VQQLKALEGLSGAAGVDAAWWDTVLGELLQELQLQLPASVAHLCLGSTKTQGQIRMQLGALLPACEHPERAQQGGLKRRVQYQALGTNGPAYKPTQAAYQASGTLFRACFGQQL
jgi:hypothetical protein